MTDDELFKKYNINKESQMKIDAMLTATYESYPEDLKKRINWLGEQISLKAKEEAEGVENPTNKIDQIIETFYRNNPQSKAILRLTQSYPPLNQK